MRGVEARGTKPAPSQPTGMVGTQTLPPPPSSFTGFPDVLRDVWKSGAGGWGRGGGVWGEGCRQQSQRRMPLACSAYSRLLTPPYPPPPQDRVYRPPSHPRGGDAPGGEGGMVGLTDGSTPQAPAPTRNHLRSLSPVSLGEKGHWVRVPEMVRVGTGALWGLLR